MGTRIEASAGGYAARERLLIEQRLAEALPEASELPVTVRLAWSLPWNDSIGLTFILQGAVCGIWLCRTSPHLL
jgi:hypothetical protein